MPYRQRTVCLQTDEGSIYKILKYRGQEVELYNKPVQKPWPPLWFPSSNRKSIAFTARHGYHTALIARLADCKPLFDEYREIWQRHRNDPGRHNAHVATPFLAKTQHLVVADTEAEAEKTRSSPTPRIRPSA
ncbi:MAG: LLM class flavin-dependent oxidoreductase [Betaproteobacteria bacterium]|nr:LLM class flavin-dependent oxidoreductase [Betaproteobacteria bacterium]